MQKSSKAFHQCEEVTKDEAREIFKNDPYKLELIEEHSEDEGGFDYLPSGWIRGPGLTFHQQAVSKSSPSHVAGAYWRGNSIACDDAACIYEF